MWPAMYKVRSLSNYRGDTPTLFEMSFKKILESLPVEESISTVLSFLRENNIS